MKNIVSFVNTSYGLNKIQNFFLFLTLFSVIIDPSNSFLGIKNISFILFFVVSIPNLKFGHILYIFLFFSIIFICLAINFSSENINLGYVVATCKSFMFLFLLLFVFDNKNYFKYFFLISLILAITICSIWLLVVIFPSLFVPFAYFFKNGKNFLFSFSKRSFLGLDYTSVYHSTSMLSTVFLSYSCYKFFFEKNKKFFLAFVIFSFSLFCSGTRANMLCGIAIPLFVYIMFLLKKKMFSLFSFVIVIILTFFTILLYKLMTDVGETSLDVKNQILESYIDLFNSNPFDYLIFGDGPGAEFFTRGHNKIVTHTELSYLDLIRNYGIVFAIVIVCLYLYPLVEIFNKYNIYKFLSFALGYIAFLFISGTNPYLLNSNGFSFLVLMWYIGNAKEEI